jgi:hypothetical protein
MDFDIIDLKLAALLVHPKIDVVILILAARLAIVGISPLAAAR